MSKKLFPLIESLVVIAIIALLAAMFLSALKRAHKTAKTILCRGNLRQNAVSLFSYAGDNSGWGPTGWFESGWNYQAAGCSFTYVNPLFGNSKTITFKAPSIIPIIGDMAGIPQNYHIGTGISALIDTIMPHFGTGSSTTYADGSARFLSMPNLRKRQMRWPTKQIFHIKSQAAII
ncbi:MAG: hypothetical protein A2X49_06075 [Lentisphaerae bacterium GWF2_52_8]|nr:MAG: hypothetical protein A2X49_06075 [Lentisphaerae bacterium GWF2_52_8]